MLLATEIPSEPYIHPAIGHGFSAINVDTVRNTLIVCAILVGIGVFARLQSRPGSPGGLQNLLEYFVDAISQLVKTTLGTRPIRLIPIAITLFAFIFVSNLIGLVPFLKSPTNDVNTAVALALFSVSILHFQSIRFRGFRGYVRHFFSVVTPSWKNPLGALARILFGVLEILQEVVKPVTLSFRLYFNIFVGELMLAIILTLLGPVSPIINGLVWIPFSTFIGLIQAFIFVMLTISYVNQGTETHDDAHDAGAQAH
jgi:F-type H+-transporting ATPase subunit a